MSNPLTSGAPANAFTPADLLQQIKANPAGFLKQANINIPNGMNNPDQIINYLMQSGQINNPRLAMARMMAQRPQVMSLFKR
jgi:hypothetical protein